MATLAVGELVVSAMQPKSKRSVSFKLGERLGGLIQAAASSADFARRENELLFGDMKDGELSERSFSEWRCLIFLRALPFVSIS